ncbi:three-prime repair exonuclease 1-like isoform X2 [Biomphalaria glabrata]|uniref:Three-prime repair exonuclease 1-like isoform X2 n=1 Tax=Biomphalaria glabrata TaxID=6526 RepID=A0A9W3B9U9_BIOGL|nr:three-prime repair exonuclease 1-like isoform X2 [Biomphalaria glabrata]XP_013064319.2 three-prime repair exonuclease 1-like isoform X2 [Biomphalaria glabrata]XP_013064321.2 three-prime repair exonuclease 1-like isoform X2 [Biomphalaria glabrata]XP_055896230.1 three-prime repair exonuclease 1-like isoform X2 [Biomphalaria glabrata]XP_055896231.1 three-prime repair exonuclease 1-like isoform X2 [Biomphalaria glabrata]XP_055896232.1 three-prime repair exonuclease 1-like isoform X2 [Biomphalar
MNSSLSHNIKTLVMFDTETTGLQSPGNNPRITELCFVALQKDELLSKCREIRVMNKLLLCFNPFKRLSKGCIEITGLCNDALEAYPSFKTQANLICSFLKTLPRPACLVAHNGARFDFPLLVSHLKNSNEEIPSDILCVDSLEALRELDGLPRVPDFVLNRKSYNCTQKSNNAATSVQTIEGTFTPNDLLSSASIDQSPSDEVTPRKQPKLSVDEVSEWRREETTPNTKTHTDFPVVEQNIRRTLFTDPEDPSCTKNEIMNGALQSAEKLKCSCLRVCQCDGKDKLNPKPVTTTSVNGKGSIQSSYSLINIYRRLFGQAPEKSHSAEGDCLILLDILRTNAKEFCDWCNRNAVSLLSVERMY